MEARKDTLKVEWIKGDPETLSAHSVDDLTPKAVAFPESLEQVSQVVKMAQKEKWAVLPWGSGSKIGVGNPPSHIDLVISTNRLNTVSYTHLTLPTSCVQCRSRGSAAH